MEYKQRKNEKKRQDSREKKIEIKRAQSEGVVVGFFFIRVSLPFLWPLCGGQHTNERKKAPTKANVCSTYVLRSHTPV